MPMTLPAKKPNGRRSSIQPAFNRSKDRRMAVKLPRPLGDRRNVIQVRRGQAETDTSIIQLLMRVVAAMIFPNRFGVDVAGLCLDQRAFLEMRFEQALCRHEKSRAVVAVPIGVAQ